MVQCTWTPVSSDGLCPLDTEGPACVFKAIQHHPHKTSMLLGKSKQMNTWEQPQNDHLMVVAHKFNSKYIWIPDVNKVITLWTENPFNGCAWIPRGWQIKGQRPRKANLANLLWLSSFCEWRSLLCTFAGKVGAYITQAALQPRSWLLAKSVTSRPVEVKRGRTLSSPLIPLAIYFLPPSSPLYREFITVPESKGCWSKWCILWPSESPTHQALHCQSSASPLLAPWTLSFYKAVKGSKTPSEVPWIVSLRKT